MYHIRKLVNKDYHGYIELLKQLTTVGNITYEDYSKQLKKIKSTIFVIIDKNTNILVACGSIFIEHKIIHSLGKVGHIEDVVVNKEYRGKGLGKMIVNHLTKYSEKEGCYKIILDCHATNAGFYQKCGYVIKGVAMAKYFI